MAVPQDAIDGASGPVAGADRDDVVGYGVPAIGATDLIALPTLADAVGEIVAQRCP